jgi:hypothetical protein
MNNPSRFRDPSGHRAIEEQRGGRGCFDPQYCRHGKPKPITELREMHEANSCIITVPGRQSKLDELMAFLQFGAVIDVGSTFEDATEMARPVYKQVKYIAPFGALEYAIDASLQLYDDRAQDLNIAQRASRAGIVAIESALIDGASMVVGGVAAVGLQVNLPVPIAAAGAGYAIGAYSSSAVLTQLAQRKNPLLFQALGLGGP